jgi:hypothetical protein
MAELDLTNIAAASINTPAAGVSAVFVDTADKHVKQRDESGTLNTLNNDGLQDLSILTNGGFSVQQRVATAATAIPSVSTTTRAGRVADRWAVTVGNVTTPLWTQVDAGTIVETGLLNRYYGRITQNTNAAKFILSQFLANQDIAHLRGGKVRLSVKMKQFAGANANYRLGLLQLTSAGTIDVDPAFISAIGAASVEPTWGTNLVAIIPDASPVGENGTISGVALTIASTAAWVRSSVVFSIPSNCLNLVAVLYRDTLGAASDSVGIAEFQMTQGPDLVDWVSLPWAFELSRCLRYFCKTFSYATVPVQAAGGNTGEHKWIKVVLGASAGRSPCWAFPLPMWRSPATITTFNPVAANAQARDATGAVDCSATTVVGTTDRQTAITFTGNAATAAENLIDVHLTADAEFIN